MLSAFWTALVLFLKNRFRRGVTAALEAQTGEHTAQASTEVATTGMTGKHHVQVAEVTNVDKIGSGWQSLAQSAQRERDKAQRERDAATKERDAAHEELATEQAEHRGCLERVGALEEGMKTLQAQVEQLTKTVNELKTALQSTREERDGANKDAELLRQALERAEQSSTRERERLEATVARERVATERAHAAELRAAKAEAAAEAIGVTVAQLTDDLARERARGQIERVGG